MARRPHWGGKPMSKSKIKPYFYLLPGLALLLAVSYTHLTLPTILLV